MARRRLGELLLEQGAVTREQLDAALAYQRQTGNRLGAALVEQGVLSEKKLATALAAALGLEVVVVSEAEVEWGALHALRDRFCEANDLFPVSLDETKARKVLTVAMSDPLNLPAIEEIEFTTGFKVHPKVATLSDVRAAIRRHYHRAPAEGGAGRQAGPTARPDAPMAGLTMSPTASGGYPRTSPSEPSGPFPGLTPSQSQVTQAARPSSKSNAARTRPASRGTPAVPAKLPAAPPSEQAAREALTELIRAKEEAVLAARSGPSVSSDLEYLVGEVVQGHEPNEQLERVERQLWALMRLMAKKGLITREEFLSEFED